jgi:hypothetical protein
LLNLQLTYMEAAIKGFLRELAALHLNGWERRSIQ